MAVASERPLMPTGLLRLVVVPSPSWPESFDPHPHTFPDSRANEWKPPAEIVLAPLIAATMPGVLLVVAVPSPNWPDVFDPQAQMVPSERNASECSFPAAIAIIGRLTTMNRLL
jgi:hypothetical protein